MGKSAPKAPDLTPYAEASKEMAEAQRVISEQQLAWAREQDTMNRQLFDEVWSVQRPIMEQQYQNAQADRARYEQVYQPLENNLIQEFQQYDTPERQDLERGRAIADVNSQFDAQRRNALQRLESFGVDPSQTRNAALDIGMRTQQAAVAAGAASGATRNVENTGRALRAEAINIGRGMPSQVAASYGQALAAGQAGVAGTNQTSATSGNLMGNPTSWGQMASSNYGQGANIMSQNYSNQLAGYNAQQQANSSMMSGIGSIAGMMMMRDGGDVPKYADAGMPGDPYTEKGAVMGPGDGTGIDDQVPALLSSGEYVIPKDVVQQKGVEFFDKLVERYHTPAAQQRKALGG